MKEGALNGLSIGLQGARSSCAARKPGEPKRTLKRTRLIEAVHRHVPDERTRLRVTGAEVRIDQDHS
jgi:phage head maturation protease